jgi:uncharacterized membrane protein
MYARGIYQSKKSTSERIELSILRLTVARLNQLGHEVMFATEKISIHLSKGVNLQFQAASRMLCGSNRQKRNSPIQSI